jgi:hypothetical protein
MNDIKTKFAGKKGPTSDNSLKILELSQVDKLVNLSIQASQLTNGILLPANVKVAESIQSLVEYVANENSALGFSSFAVAEENSIWEMYLKQLRDKISGDAPNFKGVQLLTTPQNASWNDSKTGNYIAWNVLGNSIPQWSPIYIPTPKEVTQGYKTFLLNLLIPQVDQAEQEKAKKASKKWDDALTELEDTLDERIFKWEGFNNRQQSLPPDKRLSFDSWNARTWGRRIGVKEDFVRLAYQEYRYYLGRATKGYEVVIDAIDNFSNEAFEVEAESPSGLKQRLKTFEITPSLTDFINESGAIPAGSPPAWSFKLTENSVRYSLEETRWSGGVGYLGGFFAYAGGSGGSTRLSTSNSTFLLEFSAKNIRTFTIQPGQWWTGAVVQGFKNGPFLPDGPIGNGTVDLWGVNGVLNLLPRQIVVVYQPKFVIRSTQSEYDEVKSRVSGSGGFSIGGFGFGASYGRSSTDISFDDSSMTITAADTTNSPQILAFITLGLPDFS